MARDQEAGFRPFNLVLGPPGWLPPVAAAIPMYAKQSLSEILSMHKIWGHRCHPSIYNVQGLVTPTTPQLYKILESRGGGGLGLPDSCGPASGSLVIGRLVRGKPVRPRDRHNLSRARRHLPPRPGGRAAVVYTFAALTLTSRPRKSWTKADPQP